MDKEPDLSTLGGDWDAQDSIGQGDDESLSLAHSQTQPSPETVCMYNKPCNDIDNCFYS